MTIYLYVMQQEQRVRISQIYAFANEYLRSWFPQLPSYQAFNYRLNRLSEAFRVLGTSILEEYRPEDCSPTCSILDSMPIITCGGKRKGKVALEITDKGYCATKSMYFYGAKLHCIGFIRPKQMPFPEHVIFTLASESDLNVFKQDWSNITNRTFSGDKIYQNAEFFEVLARQKNSHMLTPIKAIKDQPKALVQWDKAANELFSSAVSRIRQPIESLFSWLIEKTDIQRASKVRATKGLLVHIFGRPAAAFIYLIFNP